MIKTSHQILTIQYENSFEFFGTENHAEIILMKTTCIEADKQQKMFPMHTKEQEDATIFPIYHEEQEEETEAIWNMFWQIWHKRY